MLNMTAAAHPGVGRAASTPSSSGDVLADVGLKLPRVHEQEPGGIDGFLHGGMVTAADERAVALRVNERTHSELLVYCSVAPRHGIASGYGLTFGRLRRQS